MLYWLAEHLGFPGLLNLIRYQTVRTGGAVATALIIGLIIGPKFIGWLLHSALNCSLVCSVCACVICVTCFLGNALPS